MQDSNKASEANKTENNQDKLSGLFISSWNSSLYFTAKHVQFTYSSISRPVEVL
jgi:hypothetical protein